MEHTFYTDAPYHYNCYSVAIDKNGNLISWDWDGKKLNHGGNIAGIHATNEELITLNVDGSVSSWDQNMNETVIVFDTKVDKIFQTMYSYAALLKDGIVKTFGILDCKEYCVKEELYDIVDIRSTQTAFAALRKDKCVITWGYSEGEKISMELLRNVKNLYSNSCGFIVQKEDYSIVSWGMNKPIRIVDNVKSIRYTNNDIAILKNDGTVIGEIDGLTDVVSIYSTKDTFVALKKDRSVISWGKYSWILNENIPKISNIKSISSDYYGCFLIRTEDGKNIIFGDPHYIYDMYKGTTNIEQEFRIHYHNGISQILGFVYT